MELSGAAKGTQNVQVQNIFSKNIKELDTITIVGEVGSVAEKFCNEISKLKYWYSKTKFEFVIEK